MAASRGQVDLLDCIDFTSVECLNESPSHTIENALKQGYREADDVYLESDADEQLLIYIPFKQIVKLSAIVIKGPTEEDFPANQEIVLSSDELKGKPVTLKFVKFQNVGSLTIFIENNQGEVEATKVTKISIHGTTVETTNMKELKKVG
ncbi:hypothetical protein CBR_g8269 [Chara braunii]|uniref:PITH domain-containing protein n=1 Tax=Chara braunii TaxID=69332 RepID=A0A388KLP3_CHABU|nr:hypothetical protein CBR_g8269 [Chara braunii]|eukprot:GBG70969.1 hypothetical protein CBR_g8269 [Chara braunii]